MSDCQTAQNFLKRNELLQAGESPAQLLCVLGWRTQGLACSSARGEYLGQVPDAPAPFPKIY